MSKLINFRLIIMLEVKKQGMFLSRINEEDSIRQSNVLLSEILGKKTKVPIFSMNLNVIDPPPQDRLNTYSPQNRIGKDEVIPETSPEKNKKDKFGANLGITPMKVFVGNHNNSSNMISSSMMKSDKLSQQAGVASGPPNFRSKAEDFRTFEDSQSNYTGYKQNEIDKDPVFVPKKLTNDYSEKELIKQHTVNSLNQEQGGLGDGGVNDMDQGLIQRSRTINFDRKKRKSSVKVAVNSPIATVIQNLEEHGDGEELSSPSRSPDLLHSINKQKSPPKRKDTQINFESQDVSDRNYPFMRESQENLLSTKPTNLNPGIVIFKVEEGDQEKGGNQKELPNEPQVVASTTELITSRDNKQIDPTKKQLKSILKNKTDAEGHVKRLKTSVYDQAISVQSGKTRKSKLYNISNFPPPGKRVTFASKDQVKEVESWKKYNASDYLNPKKKQECCSKCALI